MRSSTGKSNTASVSRSPAPNVNRASPIGEPRWSSARTTPVSGDPVLGRNTFTTMRAAAFSAPASACGAGAPESKMVSERSPTVWASFLTNSSPRPASMPSEIQTRSASACGSRKRASAPTVSTRSTAYGFGASWRSATRAVPAGISVMSRAGSDNGTSATARRSLSAFAINSSAVLMRTSQLAAALQPSSINSTSGPFAARSAGAGIEDRSGRGEDHERRRSQAQQRQPPRCACRRFLFRGDVEQQAGRREIQLPRPGRHQPQQPPQRR